MRFVVLGCVDDFVDDCGFVALLVDLLVLLIWWFAVFWMLFVGWFACCAALMWVVYGGLSYCLDLFGLCFVLSITVSCGGLLGVIVYFADLFGLVVLGVCLHLLFDCAVCGNV